MKLPAQAKQVFVGKIFSVYQWEQLLFDGSKATFEMLQRPNTLQVIAVQDGKICITDEEQPSKGKFFSLIGGRQDEGETPLEGAKRELLEESGLVSEDWLLYKIFEPYTKIEWEVYTFVARNCKKMSDQKLDRGEKITIKTVSFDEFCEIVFSEKFWGSEFTLDLMKMKYHEPARFEEFQKTLFG
jgi:8-oxo-dGTP pyrophosphatase MutT (NUDIX family)